MVWWQRVVVKGIIDNVSMGAGGLSLWCRDDGTVDDEVKDKIKAVKGIDRIRVKVFVMTPSGKPTQVYRKQRVHTMRQLAGWPKVVKVFLVPDEVFSTPPAKI